MKLPPVPTRLACVLLPLSLPLVVAPARAATPGAQDDGPGAPSSAEDAVEEAALDWGRSHLGAHYDEGPRRRPWPMPGVGQVHLPVTTDHPEVQAWFDQGVALLHGFWPFEAERAFRQCADLDPECAMAYWGLARATRGERSDAFLEQAREHAARATPREQAYIELLAAEAALDDADEDEREAAEAHVRVLADRLVMDHPDDLEAWAFAALTAYEHSDEEDRLGIEAMLQRILAVDPDHVGALHYRIHNWDGKEGHYAIDSCLALTEAAPDCGHLQHMPGHVLSSIGMWHEAAIAQDAATRVEQRYMHARVVMPEDNWNYMHNLDYLAHVQGQLGMHDLAIRTASQLQVIPMHLDGRLAEMAQLFGSLTRPPLLRELERAERWDMILDPEVLDWPEELAPREQAMRHRAELRAHLGLGQLAEAKASLEGLEQASQVQLEAFASMPPGQGPPPEFLDDIRSGIEAVLDQARGLLAVADGRPLEGVELLTRTAAQQADSWLNDPPHEAWFGYDLLGETLLDLGSPALAAEAFERTLETVPHDGVALAGLVRAYHALGRDDEAAAALADLEVVWSEADANHPRLAAARATGVTPATGELPEPFAQPMTQRRYRATVIDPLGPPTYRSATAPALTAVDAAGEPVDLADHRGRTVLLIFYLGDQCTHCVEQLQAAEEHHEALADLGVDVLACSKDAIEKIAAAQESFHLTLLSDPSFDSARRYGSYDEFEEQELHSTVLIDSAGNIHWVNTGGEPFMDFDFLLDEARRLQEGGPIEAAREGHAAATTR